MSDKTICGYSWNDVQSDLMKSIAAADMTRAQRWAAELVCSEGGLSRLEATLLHTWARFINVASPGWISQWMNHVYHIRQAWNRSGGDIKSVRNTPDVRTRVSEAIAWLVLSNKHPLPVIPSKADCEKEADAVRERIKSGRGAPDQVSVRAVWLPEIDGKDLLCLGNEFEESLRSGQTTRTMFWLTWFMALDSQASCPPCKERGPNDLTARARRSLAWFLVAILRKIAGVSHAGGVPMAQLISIPSLNENIARALNCYESCWQRLSAKGRKETLAGIILLIIDYIQRQTTGLSMVGNHIIYTPSGTTLSVVSSVIDTIYVQIAEEARQYEENLIRVGGVTSPFIVHPTAKQNKFDATDSATKLQESVAKMMIMRTLM
jgi:hypothetical protein